MRVAGIVAGAEFHGIDVEGFQLLEDVFSGSCDSSGVNTPTLIWFSLCEAGGPEPEAGKVAGRRGLHGRWSYWTPLTE